jgi:glutathione transport system substrate-binding protein
MRAMFEGLVGFDIDFNLVPELATGWTISDDATELVFTLRDGGAFHDGTALDAAGVVAYFDWMMDADNPAGARGRSTLGGLESWEATGPMELTLRLARPNGAFIFNLALPNAQIASPGALEGDVPRNPVGSGPFRFVEWRDGEYVLVERFDDYWGEKAAVEQIRFLVVNNAATRVAMLEAGEIDWAEEIPPALVEAVEANPDLEVQVTDSTFARIFPMNTQRPPFDDVRVRQALNYAVDKDQLALVVFRGYATVMDSPLPAPVFGHATVGPYPYDPERARALLAEAGYGPGGTTLEFDVLTFTGTEYETAGTVLQQMFGDVGVTMNFNPTERGALVEAIFQPLETSTFDAGLVGASASTGDAARALEISFARASWPPAANNWSFYENARVEELLAAGVATGDPQERLAIYAEAQRIIHEEAPWVFLYSPDNITGLRKGVTGIAYYPTKVIDPRRIALP